MMSTKNMKKMFIKISIPILFVMGLFYLFVVPVIAILNYEKSQFFELGFGLFMLAQLIILNLELGYIVIKCFYQLDSDRDSLIFGRLPLSGDDNNVKVSNSKSPRVVVVCFLCYLMTIYVFAIGYMYISGFDHDAFNTGKPLGVLDSIYFSIVTATTVGFGEIHPTSIGAKLLVMSEIIIGLLYVVVMFSSISNFLKKEKVIADIPEAPKKESKHWLNQRIKDKSISRAKRRV